MGPPDPLAGVAAAVLAAVGDAGGRPRRVFARSGRRLVLVLVWDAGDPPPTAAAGGAVAAAKRALVAAVEAAGKPVPRKALLRAVAPLGHRPGTAAKALAELVRDGELANPRDHRGYRLPAWAAARPGLFPDPEG